MAVSIPGFRVIVEKNGTSVTFSSISLSRNAGDLRGKWSITLPQPIILDPSDTWTIKKGIGNILDTVVDSENPTTESFEDGVRSYSRTIEGTCSMIGGDTGEAVSLLEYCLPKTLVYVNQQWLKLVAPNARLKNGILVQQFDTSPTATVNFDTRVYHQKLPPKEVKDDQFLCFLGNWTHRSVAQHLCGLVGYKFLSNVPDIEVQSVCTFNSGTVIFDAIKSNIQVMQASFMVDGTNIYALDILSDTNDIPGIQTFVLENKAIQSVRVKEDVIGPSKQIDKVVVTGLVQKNTSSTPDVDQLTANFDITDIPDVPLTPNHTKYYRTNFGGVYFDQFKEEGAYTGSWGEGDEEFTPEGLSYAAHTEQYYQDKNKGIMKKLQEVVSTFRDDGALVHKLVKTYFYGPEMQLTGSLQKEWALSRLPGTSDPQFYHYKTHIVSQNQFVKSIKKALTKEWIYQLVLYDVTKTGKKISPIPLMTGIRWDFGRVLIEKNKTTSQGVIMALTDVKFEKIDRDDQDTLEQKIFSYNLISGGWTMNPQTLQNPNKPENSSKDETFRREYTRTGAGKVIGQLGTCYRPAFSVSHQDICTDKVAEQIRDRVFARGENARQVVDVTTPVPVPIRAMNFLVALPDITYEVDGVDVEISGGNYVLKGMTERVTCSGDRSGKTTMTPEITLTLRNGV